MNLIYITGKQSLKIKIIINSLERKREGETESERKKITHQALHISKTHNHYTKVNLSVIEILTNLKKGKYVKAFVW